jgi:hypothetical protein
MHKKTISKILAGEKWRQRLAGRKLAAKIRTEAVEREADPDVDAGFLGDLVDDRVLVLRVDTGLDTVENICARIVSSRSNGAMSILTKIRLFLI